MPNSCATPAWVKRRAAISSLSRIASSTRSFRSLASAKPRSTSTSPLPASTASVFFSPIAHLIVGLGRSQALVDQADVLSGRPHTRGGLLLKAVQDIDGLLKTHRVDGPERIATVLFDQLEDSRSFTRSEE